MVILFNVGKSSETVPEAVATNEQGQDETTQLKTPSTSSTSVAGSSRRSRIKPAVTPVARARPKNRNKDQTTTGAQHASADKRESFSHGQKTSHINDKQLLSSEEERQEGIYLFSCFYVPVQKKTCSVSSDEAVACDYKEGER